MGVSTRKNLNFTCIRSTFSRDVQPANPIISRRLMDAGSDCNMQKTFEDGAALKSPMVEYFRSRDKVRNT